MDNPPRRIRLEALVDIIGLLKELHRGLASTALAEKDLEIGPAQPRSAGDEQNCIETRGVEGIHNPAEIDADLVGQRRHHILKPVALDPLHQLGLLDRLILATLLHELARHVEIGGEELASAIGHEFRLHVGDDGIDRPLHAFAEFIDQRLAHLVPHRIGQRRDLLGRELATIIQGVLDFGILARARHQLGEPVIGEPRTLVHRERADRIVLVPGDDRIGDPLRETAAA